MGFLFRKEKKRKTNLKRIRVNMYIKVKDDTLLERVFFLLYEIDQNRRLVKSVDSSAEKNYENNGSVNEMSR